MSNIFKALYSEVVSEEHDNILNHIKDWEAGMEEIETDTQVELELDNVSAGLEALAVGLESIESFGEVSALSERMLARADRLSQRRLLGEELTASMESSSGSGFGSRVAGGIAARMKQAWRFIYEQIKRFSELVKQFLMNMFRGKAYLEKRCEEILAKASKIEDEKLSTTELTVSEEIYRSLLEPGSDSLRPTAPENVVKEYSKLVNEVLDYSGNLCSLTNDICDHISRQIINLRKKDFDTFGIATLMFRKGPHAGTFNYKSPKLMGRVYFTAPQLELEDDKSRYDVASWTTPPMVNGKPPYQITAMKVKQVKNLTTAVKEYINGRKKLEDKIKKAVAERNAAAAAWDRLMRDQETGTIAKLKYHAPVTRMTYAYIRKNSMRAVVNALAYTHSCSIGLLNYADRSLRHSN